MSSDKNSTRLQTILKNGVSSFNPYKWQIDVHRRIAYVASGVPLYAWVEKLNGMSDVESLKARTVDTLGNLLIAGWLLKGRDSCQDKWQSDIRPDYAGAGRMMVDMFYFGVTTAGMSMGLYLGIETANGTYDALVDVIRNTGDGDAHYFSYDWERLGKTAVWAGAINGVSSPLRAYGPDFVNLLHGREPSGRFPEALNGRSEAFYRKSLLWGGMVAAVATIGAYMGL